MPDSAIYIRVRIPNQFSIVEVLPVPIAWNSHGNKTLEDHVFIVADLTIPCNWQSEIPSACASTCPWNTPAQCDRIKLMRDYVIIDDTDPENPIETLVHRYRYEVEMAWNSLPTPIKNQITKEDKTQQDMIDLFDLCASVTLRKNQQDILDKVI